jgi:hypothetical protein
MHAAKHKLVQTFSALLIFLGLQFLGCKPPEGAPGAAQGGADRDVEGRYVRGAAQQPSSNAIASNNIYLQGTEPKTAQDSKSASSGLTNRSAATSPASKP